MWVLLGSRFKSWDRVSVVVHWRQWELVEEVGRGEAEVLTVV